MGQLNAYNTLRLISLRGASCTASQGFRLIPLNPIRGEMGLSLSLALASSALLSAARRFFTSCTIIPSCCLHPPHDVEHGPSAATDHSIRRFSWCDIISATANFDPSAIIGEGGFSTLYLARLPSSTLAAVKVYHNSSCSERLRRAFLNELAALRLVHHPNITRLLGYSDDSDEVAILFEYVPGRNLHDRLHVARGDAVLTWAQRMSIAFELALAVDYLHEGCDPQIVHSDLTASNVLLDDVLSPKLCDFGSSKMGFSAAVQLAAAARGLMVGSPGYADPHYIRTGLVSKKTDVYSFGVLLLEMITGVPAFRTEEGRLLAVEMRPLLAEGRVGELVDSRLGGEYNGEEAEALVAIVIACIGEQPSLRPSMAEVVGAMRKKVPSAPISTDQQKCSDVNVGF